jgi:hypothetical protein
MNIKDRVKRHDQLAFELKLEFPAPKDRKKRQDYKVEMYLFVPQSLDINKQNYTKFDFYRSLKTNIRLTTPDYLLRKIVDGNTSPFQTLFKSIEALMDNMEKEQLAKYEIETKRFCSIFGASLRHLVQQINITKHFDDKAVLVDEFITQSARVRSEFKLLRGRVNLLNHEPAFKLFGGADEYQSLLLEKHVFILIEKLKTDGKFPVQIEQLTNLAFEETRYRKRMVYPSIVGAKRVNQDVLHRNSMLKKFIESNLFLNTDTRREAVLMEQMMFAIAAGVAMVFATGVAFLSQMIYGNLSLPFFIALVISYMFKDRIKELMRYYLDKKHKKFFADYRTSIFSPQKKKMGELKESFYFVKKKNLPKDIIEARKKIQKTDLGIELKTEKVMLFQNQIRLLKNQGNTDGFEGITQILRYNIWDLTFKMDDPEKEVYYVKKSGLKRINVERVYHINMVMRYSMDDESVIKAYRVVASKQGIKRIEKFRMN